MLEIVNTFKIATEEEKENFKNRASDALKVADTPNAFLGWLCLTLKMEKFSDMDETRISGKHILLAEDNDLNAAEICISMGPEFFEFFSSYYSLKNEQDNSPKTV